MYEMDKQLIIDVIKTMGELYIFLVIIRNNLIFTNKSLYCMTFSKFRIDIIFAVFVT